MSQKMTSENIRLGVWVQPLPSYKDVSWARRHTWPQQINEIIKGGFDNYFKLSGSTGAWSTTGLCVVDLEVVENE
jgi:hypothetical protein